MLKGFFKVFQEETKNELNTILLIKRKHDLRKVSIWNKRYFLYTLSNKCNVNLFVTLIN